MTLWACVGLTATLVTMAFVANVVWAIANERGIWQLVGLPAAGAFWYWAVSVAWERSGHARGRRGTAARQVGRADRVEDR